MFLVLHAFSILLDLVCNYCMFLGLYTFLYQIGSCVFLLNVFGPAYFSILCGIFCASMLFYIRWDLFGYDCMFLALHAFLYQMESCVLLPYISIFYVCYKHMFMDIYAFYIRS